MAPTDSPPNRRPNDGPAPPPYATPFLSVGEAAAALGTSRATLYRAIKAGAFPLPVLVVGRRMRIARRAVDRVVAGHAPGEPGPDASSLPSGPHGRIAPSGLKRLAGSLRPRRPRRAPRETGSASRLQAPGRGA